MTVKLTADGLLCVWLSLSLLLSGAAPYGQGYPQAAYGQPIAAYPNPYSNAGYMYPYPQHYGMCTRLFTVWLV